MMMVVEKRNRYEKGKIPMQVGTHHHSGPYIPTYLPTYLPNYIHAYQVVEKIDTYKLYLPVVEEIDPSPKANQELGDRRKEKRRKDSQGDQIGEHLGREGSRDVSK